MSVTTIDFDTAYALFEAHKKAEYEIGRMASGAQMPGAAFADNTAYAAEVDALIGALTTASAAVATASDEALVSDGFTYDDGTNTYTVDVTDGVVTVSHVVN